VSESIHGKPSISRIERCTCGKTEPATPPLSNDCSSRSRYASTGNAISHTRFQSAAATRSFQPVTQGGSESA
jgi:hypothetical protein